ncbi:MAG: CRTAC1 family protein [Bryobacteraceae bacterium]
MKKLLIATLGAALWIATGTQPAGTSLFTDIASQAGIRFRHQGSHTSQKYLIETMGSGVAWLDYDGDGNLDLFFVNGAGLRDPMPRGKAPDKSDPRYWNRLYRNTGHGAFVDVTQRAGLKGEGYGMGVAVGDYDNDGRPDLYVTGFRHNHLYHNQGDGTFEDVTDRAGVGGSGWSTGAAFFDYDGDGRLDLVVARYLDWDFDKNIWCGPEKAQKRGYCHPNAFQAVTHLLYHNEGNGKFRDVSQSSGIAAHPGKGLGVAINDSDGDGRPDILIANDSVAQQLFHNNGIGTFSEVALDKGVAYNSNGSSFAGMGVDWDDYNNDGWPDVFLNALSLQGYVLLRNTRGEYEDVADLAGLSAATMLYGGWGTKFVDYDNDGWKDVFVAQGHVMDTISVDFPSIQYKQHMLLMRNLQGHYEDVSLNSGSSFRVPLAARGAAFGDFDNDGSMDVVVNTNDGTPVLLHNSGSKNHWIVINTIGRSSNRDGIGARVRLVGSAGLEQYGFVSTASSYLSASDKRVHFGLGSDKRVRQIEIHWPSGVVQKLNDVAVDQILTIKEPK